MIGDIPFFRKTDSRCRKQTITVVHGVARTYIAKFYHSYIYVYVNNITFTYRRVTHVLVAFFLSCKYVTRARIY